MQLSESESETSKTETETIVAEVADITEDNPGMSLLDQAIEEKLKATNEQDLSNVLALAQRARKEGLQSQNLKFCDEFIASVQVQRGILLSSRIVSKPVDRLPESWTVIRTRSLNDLESAVKIIKSQPEVFIRIAQLHLMPGGDQQKAKKALDDAEAISKNQPDLFAQVIVIKTMLEDDPAKREELLAKATKEVEDRRLIFFHAMSLIELKRYNESIGLLKSVLEKDPENAQALQLILGVYCNVKQFDEALAVLDKLEKILHLDAADIFRARIHADMGKKDEAMRILDKLHEKLPESVEVLLARASLASEMKQYDRAIKDADAVIGLIGNKDEQQTRAVKIVKVQFLISSDKFDEASRILDELEKVAPDDIGIKILRIDIFHNQKKYSEALELVELLLKDRSDLVLLRVKGNILLSMRRHSDAVKIFEEVIKEDPLDKTTLNNLSWLLSTSTIDMVRNGKRALELAERACELTDYKVAYILSTLAAAHAELGDFKKAVEFSQKSIDLSAEDPNVSNRVEDLREELETYKKNMPYRELPKE
ncbi:MAG: tetratricopeptide repeat protein [Planctomycetaceae bacterium]|nr:tetratricopeptide repeat protein [Planctomycetaceae bacterium]